MLAEEWQPSGMRKSQHLKLNLCLSQTPDPGNRSSLVPWRWAGVERHGNPFSKEESFPTPNSQGKLLKVQINGFSLHLQENPNSCTDLQGPMGSTAACLSDLIIYGAFPQSYLSTTLNFFQLLRHSKHIPLQGLCIYCFARFLHDMFSSFRFLLRCQLLKKPLQSILLKIGQIFHLHAIAL